MKENATMEIVNVPFGNDVIPATIDDDKVVWSVVSYICQNIGLTEKQKDAQVKKCQTDLILKEGSRILSTLTAGGKQSCLCIKNEYLPIWLAKITLTPTMQRDNPQAVEKIKKYQFEAKDVLAEYFGFKEKEKLAPVVQTTQFATTIPDSVASAMMMMQVNTINAFKESMMDTLTKQNDMFSHAYKEQTSVLKEITTYTKALQQSNNDLVLRNEVLEERNKLLVEKLDNFINNFNNISLTEQLVTKSSLTTEQMAWKKTATNRVKEYAKASDQSIPNSYIEVYKGMEASGIDIYKEKAKHKNLCKIDVCSINEDYQKVFDAVINDLLAKHYKNEETATPMCTRAIHTPQEFKNLVARLDEKMDKHKYVKLFNEFESCKGINLKVLKEKVKKDRKVKNCTTSFAIYMDSKTWKLFKEFVAEKEMMK